MYFYDKHPDDEYVHIQTHQMPPRLHLLRHHPTRAQTRTARTTTQIRILTTQLKLRLSTQALTAFMPTQTARMLPHLLRLRRSQQLRQQLLLRRRRMRRQRLIGYSSLLALLVQKYKY